MTQRGDLRMPMDARGLQRWVLVGSVSACALTLQFALDAAVGRLVLMTLGIVLIMALAITFRAERRLPLPCDPLVMALVFMAQFFVIGAPALVILDFYVFHPMSPDRGVLILSLFAVLVVSFFIGYQVRLGHVLADLIPDFERSPRRVPWIWVETAIIAAGVLGCLLSISSLGGVGKMVRTGYGRNEAKPIYQLAYHTLLAGTFLMAWRVDRRARTRVATWAPLVALIGAEVIFFGIISGARKWLFYLFFGLVCIRLLRHGAGSLPKMRVAATFTVLILFFSIWVQVRSQPLTQIMSGQYSDPRGGARDPFYMGYFKSVSEPFEVASLVVDVYPSQHPYEYGKTLLVTLFGFIPRSVWADKPIGISTALARYTDGALYEETRGHSIAPTFVGDFYANLGLLGVLLGGLVFGVVCRTVAAYASTGLHDGVQLSAMRVILPSAFVAGLAEVRGDTATMLAFYVMVTVPILIACATSRLDTPREVA